MAQTEHRTRRYREGHQAMESCCVRLFSVAVPLLLVLGLTTGVICGVMLPGLPATVSLAENSPPGTEVICFPVTLTPGVSIAVGFPQILNTDPVTDAFLVSMENSTHAMVTVAGSPNLDFETPPNTFVIQILVVDSIGDADIQTLTVLLSNVDEPPLFLDGESVLYVVEKTPPGKIFQPIVFDPENKPLTFSLSPPDPAFLIDSTTGFIFTSKEFSYQMDPRSYAFNLSVSDGNNTALQQIFIRIVNLEDDKPRFLNSITAFSLPEELSPGHVMANITAVAPDDSRYGGFIFYSIRDNHYLAIHQYSGTLTIANRMDRDVAPLRDAPIITVTVTATFSPPGPPLSNTIDLTLTVTDINDNPPICSPDNQRREILETEAAGAIIATVTCSDNDVEFEFRQFTFTSLSCLGCPLLFSLTDNQITLNGNVDFEDPANLGAGSEYTLLAVATDTDNPSLRGDAYVYVTVAPVNEFSPVFEEASYFYSISELLGAGSVIGSVMATDEDLPPTPLLYSLVSGGGPRNIFHLDPSLGRITLLTNPDFEDTQTHSLVVRVLDGDLINPRSALTTVVINITEANDEPPLCGPNKTILVVPTDLRVGSSVQGFSLTCTDKDSPPVSFIYTISGATNVNNHFGFSPSAGTNITRLILREPFDYSSGADQLWSYSLTVLISDANLLGGPRVPTGPAQTGTVIINVRMVDPDLTTIITTTTPAITYVSIQDNRFAARAWYVWFFIALGALLLLGMLGYLLFCCCKFISTRDSSWCRGAPPDMQGPILDKGPPAKEVVMELTKINTVFDGEEVDPVTKRMYVYNSKSGARRWKDAAIISEPASIPAASNTLAILMADGRRAAPMSSANHSRESSPPDLSQIRNSRADGPIVGRRPATCNSERFQTSSSSESLSANMAWQSSQKGKAGGTPDAADISEV